jgi:hypothetical protein
VTFDSTKWHWDDLGELEALDPGLLQGRDVALLINTLMLKGDPELWDWVRLIAGIKNVPLPQLPNHWITLSSKVKTADNGELSISYWTGGEVHSNKPFSPQLVEDNYFGALIAER